jgi:hypothetical protein
MNTLNVLYRDMTCAAGAFVITFVLGLSFVQSTAVAPGTRPAAVPMVSLQILQVDPVWFGQPQPAVLVD